MVRNTATALLLVMTLTSSCSLKNIWGEAAPAPQVISQPLSTDSCPEVKMIVDSPDEPQARAVLECWASKTDSVWHDVQGASKDSLSDREIAQLVRKEAIQMDGDRESNLRKILSAKKLLGIQGPLTRQDLKGWISWTRDHLREIRHTYQVFHLNKSDRIEYSDISTAAKLAASFLVRADLNLSADELAETILPFEISSNPYITKSLRHLSRVALNFTAFFCVRGDRTMWKTSEVGTCVSQAVDHFRPGAAWFEFVLNPQTVATPREPILKALDDLEPAVNAWFSRPGLVPVDTGLWITLAQSLDLPVTMSALHTIHWVTKFDDLSNENSIHPRLIKRAFSVVKQYQRDTLNGMYFFTRCEDPKAEWTACLPDFQANDVASSTEMSLARRVHNEHYGEKIVPLNGAEFRKLMFFHAMSTWIVQRFDGNDDGHITVADTHGEADELPGLINVSFSYLKNTTFVQNVIHRLQNKPIEVESKDDPLRKFRMNGLANLTTMFADTLVPPTKKEMQILSDILANIKAPKSAFHLEPENLTGVLSTLDFLGTFRGAYLETTSERDHGILAAVTPEKSFSDVPGETLVSRKAVLESMPEILKQHFPRIHESCEKFGYDLSCGPSFDGILPSSDENPEMISASDLDVITLVAVFMESLMDSCDKNHDDILDWDFLNGNDELDCAFIRMKDLVFRLMDADIIKDNRMAKFALKLANLNSLTRVPGKMAMVKGSRDKLVWNTLTFPFHNHATMGSMFGLFADVANEDAVHAAKAERKKKH